jgi:uncharacterized membrane protein YkgB
MKQRHKQGSADTGCAAWLPRCRARFDAIDAAVVRWMDRTGHGLHRITLGLVFVWFGALKIAGYPTVTTILAHTVFLGPPDVTVRILGGWEVLIGVCLIIRPLIRVALPLLLLRLVGTAAAMVLKADVCFVGAPWVPTPEGQYLVKDLMLFAAAVVIGGTARPHPIPPSR